MSRNKKSVFSTQGLVEMPFRLMWSTGKFLLEKQVLEKETGASFSRERDYRNYLNSRNNGLLVDGKNLSFSEEDSFENFCLVASIGAGKTSQYVIPNVINRAKKNCSLVVNDPSGEIYAQTSQYMADNGYNILVLNPDDLSHTSFFNPFLEARSLIEMEQIARILVRAGSPGSSNSDPFWLDGAERFVSLFAKCLLNADDMNHFTLSNLYHVLQNFGSEGNGLYRFMEIYTKIPGRPYDNTLVDEWNALLVGNPKTIDGMIMSAQVALKSLASSNIAKITSFSSFSLSELRERKTIIYFISPSQHASYYAFFTSIFFQSVFNSAMRKLPSGGDLPIYVLYDEFAHSTIPDFTTTVTTIRKYRVSISVVLQSIKQLDIRYGKDQAEAMLGGFNSYMTLSGSDLQTTKFFEGMVGSVRRETRDRFLDPKRKFDERNLMNSDEVRRMGEREMLLVSTNRQAVKVNMQPFFENREMMRAVRRGAYQLPRNNGNVPLRYVPLR